MLGGVGVGVGADAMGEVLLASLQKDGVDISQIKSVWCFRITTSQ
jgi:sugar/nucleoside kinase (ribokinase family)